MQPAIKLPRFQIMLHFITIKNPKQLVKPILIISRPLKIPNQSKNAREHAKSLNIHFVFSHYLLQTIHYTFLQKKRSSRNKARTARNATP